MSNHIEYVCSFTVGTCQVNLSEADVERVMGKIHKHETACWIWTGSLTSDGYGKIKLQKKTVAAHRLSWLIHRGTIPKGFYVLHNCPNGDNRACVNPSHLWVGTQKDNIRDMISKGRSIMQTHPELYASKLTEAAVVAIRLRYSLGELQHVLASEYHVSEPYISQIVSKRSWRHV